MIFAPKKKPGVAFFYGRVTVCYFPQHAEGYFAFKIYGGRTTVTNLSAEWGGCMGVV